MCLITNRGLGQGGFAFYNVRTDSSGNVDSTTTNEIFNIDRSGGTTIYSVTDSTSVSTGALIVDGGVGIAKNSNNWWYYYYYKYNRFYRCRKWCNGYCRWIVCSKK